AQPASQGQPPPPSSALPPAPPPPPEPSASAPPPEPPASASSEAVAAPAPRPRLSPRTSWATPPGYPSATAWWHRPARPTPKGVWYGWQILIPALISDAMVLGGGLSLNAGNGGEVALGVLIAGAVTHVIAGPIVHFAHSQAGRGGISFVLEGVAP